jgi:DDE superfamily endonuclease
MRRMIVSVMPTSPYPVPSSYVATARAQRCELQQRLRARFPPMTPDPRPTPAGSRPAVAVPPLLAAWLAPFRDGFTAAVWPRVLVLVVGAVLAPGQRTVSAALRVMGLADRPGFGRYHEVLSEARWDGRALARRLLVHLLARLLPEGEVVIVPDDSIERRWGPRIRDRGIYRDPVRSSRGFFVKTSGLRWLSLAVVLPIPWAKRRWALPFLTILAPSQRANAERGRRHKPLTRWAIQAILQTRRWLPERAITIVADSSFACLELIAAVRRHVRLITRLRLDASLFAPAPPRRPGQRGPKACKGHRLAKLIDVLANPATRWGRVWVSEWYGDGSRVLEIVSATAIWYHAGLPPAPIRWVLVRDPAGRREPQAFLSTNLDDKPGAILGRFVWRWRIETTFQEVRRHLGVETQRQWSDLAILRTTPVLLGLFSLVTLWAGELTGDGLAAPHPRAAAWYAKLLPTFSDAIATVRRALWCPVEFSISRPGQATIEIPITLLQRLLDTVGYAA